MLSGKSRFNHAEIIIACSKAGNKETVFIELLPLLKDNMNIASKNPEDNFLNADHTSLTGGRVIAEMFSDHIFSENRPQIKKLFEL